MSFTGFSQVLTPKVEISEADTFFCFTLPQSRIIAKELLHAQYSDSIVMALEEKNCLQYELILKKDSIIASQSAMISNYSVLQKTYEGKLEALTKALAYEQKKARRYKRISWLTGIGMVALGVTAAVK
jgi:hypothetical protein